MSKSKDTEIKPFSLETDDRTDEERSRGKQVKKDRLVTALGMGSPEKVRSPMDSDYVEDVADPTPEIKFNLHFDRQIRGVAVEDRDQRDARFDRSKLFEAVSSGDVAQLQGLQQYLHRSMKRLTDSEFKLNGKTALLKALMNLKEGINPTVEFLLDIAEKKGYLKEFVNAAYTDSYYKGQTGLHVAIERRSSRFLKLLIQKGADVHAKACGKFFQLHNEPCFYFGELPLSLAACTNQKEMVDFLMENPYQKVDVKERDSQGNMVLHALVVVADNSPENTDFVIAMYDHVLTRACRLHPKIRLEDLENNQGLTPIKLAAKTGKIGLFEYMMHREFQDQESRHLSRKFTEWVYGPVYSSLYDLASLDSYEKNSVLEIIVYGSEIPNRLEMLQVEPLNRLLEEKWERFARKIFFFNFLVYVLYLSIFTMVAYYRKEGMPSFHFEQTRKEYLHITGQLITALGAIYFFFKGLLEMKRKRPRLQNLLIDGYDELIFFLQAVLFLTSSVLYCCGREEYLGFLVLCLAFSWINLLYFSRGSRHMGIYNVMIQKMILTDILRFLFVYMVFLFGFSAAVSFGCWPPAYALLSTLQYNKKYEVIRDSQQKVSASQCSGRHTVEMPVVTLMNESPRNTTSSTTTTTTTSNNITLKSRSLFKSVGNSNNSESETNCKKPTFKNIYFTTLELFKFTIGMGDLEFTEQYQYKEVFYVLLITYIVLTYILLLNMLIALMSRTVEKMSRESTSIWKLQRAITILDMERSLPKCLIKRSGVEVVLGRSNGEDRRWCFRVEEVNWNKWNSNLGIINEDPGNYNFTRLSPPLTMPERGRSWRGYLQNFNNRRRPRRRTFSGEEEREMSPLSLSDV